MKIPGGAELQCGTQYELYFGMQFQHQRSGEPCRCNEDPEKPHPCVQLVVLLPGTEIRYLCGRTGRSNRIQQHLTVKTHRPERHHEIPVRSILHTAYAVHTAQSGLYGTPVRFWRQQEIRLLHRDAVAGFFYIQDHILQH